MLKLDSVDRIFAISTIMCFLFWFFFKIPYIHNIALFSAIYQIFWLIVFVLCIVCSLYFFVKYLQNKFIVKSLHFYFLLIGVITLLIARFVFSISFEGIVFQ